MANRSASFASGHGKQNPLEVNIPAPSGENFIPSAQRGPRPELPHKETEGAYGDFAPIELNDQQKKENAHIKTQQANWDAHDTLEKQAKAKPVAQPKADFNEEELEPEARERLAREAGQFDGNAPKFAPLNALHSELTTHLETLRPHLNLQHDVVREAQRAAVQSYNKGNELDLKHKGMLSSGQVPSASEVEEKKNLLATSSNLANFGQKHFRALNRHATAESYLNKAATLMSSGKTADATDLMMAAHKELHSMAKHLSSPVTKQAYELAGKYAPVPDPESIRGVGNALQGNIGAEGGGVGRKRGPQGDAPKINIGKPGRLKGDRGSQETIVADEAGLQSVKDKYGTQHPYYKKVKEAHVAWKRGKTSNPSVRQIALTPEDQKEKRDNDAVLEAMRGGGAFKSPEERQQEFKVHAMRVDHAIRNGLAIPGESADHIGPENVQKLMKRYGPKEN